MNSRLLPPPPRSNLVSHRTGEPRLDNFISWFAASVLVTAGIIYVASSFSHPTKDRTLLFFLHARRQRRNR